MQLLCVTRPVYILRSLCFREHGRREIRTRPRFPDRLAEIRPASPLSQANIAQASSNPSCISRERLEHGALAQDTPYKSNTGFANTQNQHALNEDVRPPSEVKSKPSDCGKGKSGLREVPDSLLEHWSINKPPTLSQRRFANQFFTSHRPDLIFTAASLHQVKFTSVPEIAFVGRSNVGKSTLLNALLGQRVAYTSRTPGKTKTLNAWAIGGRDQTGRKWRLTVLDMPGYGHGSREEWGKSVAKYLARRKELKRAFVLINASHGFKESDREMLQHLRQAAVPHQIVLSKVDLCFDIKGKKAIKHSGTGRLFNERELAAVYGEVAAFVAELRRGSRGQSGGLLTSDDVLAVSAESPGLLGQKPEPRHSLGITALRWAVLSAGGISPTSKVKDEKELSFV